MRKLFFTAACLLLVSSPAFAAKQTLTSSDTGAQSRTKLNANFTELYDGKSDKTAVVRYWTDWPTTGPNNVLAVDTIVAYEGSFYKVTQQLTKTGSTADPETLTAYFDEVTGGSDYTLPTATDTVLGGVKVGARLSIADGVLSADVQTGEGSMVYPGAGIPVSTGSAWGTSLSTTAPAFSSLSLGAASTTTGIQYFYGNTKAFPFSIFSQGADAPSVGWRLPSTVPAITSLPTIDANGYWAYIDPATFATPTGSAASMTVVATGFDGNLDTNDNTLQEIAQALDDLVVSGGTDDQTASEVAFTPNGSIAATNVQAAIQEVRDEAGSGHTEVTLGADADVLLGLSGQQVTLDSQTANYVFAAPNGSAGDPTFRVLVAADIPTLNQSTTGNAATATALAANPTDCSAGQYATTIAANGNLTCSQVSYSQIGSTPTLGTVAQYNVGTGANNIPQLNSSGELPYTIPQLTSLQTASGLTSGDLHLGTFTGTTIADSSTMKTAFQALETAVEGKQGTITFGTGVQTALGVNVGSNGAVALFNGAMGTPSFTAVNLPSSDADPSTTAGQLRHDTTITGMTGGALKYWNGTNARILVDLDTAPVTDDYVVAYDADADKFYMKADATGAGGTLTSGDIDTSSELRGIVTDESGTGALLFAGGDIGGGTATTPSANDNDTSIATTAYVQSELSAYASDTVTLTNKSVTAVEVDGSAAGTLTAAQVSGTIITNRGQAASDVALTLPTAAAGYNALFTVGTAQTNKWGVRAGTNDKIYLLNADGTISAGSDNGYARMTAAQVGQAFACWTFQTGASAWDWQCKASAIGTSTFAAN
jgi:hypothetical protein